jgi:N-acetylglutamate synthase-like GNAT family acetyltransferase
MNVLRRPLGLTFTAEQLTAEHNDIHVGAYENDQVVACCVLSHYQAGILQLRQMAVSDAMQSKGIGRKLLVFAEEVAREKGYQILMMHARKVAIGFYEKCGYTIDGDEFIEVTIPHYHMQKQL